MGDPTGTLDGSPTHEPHTYLSSRNPAVEGRKGHGGMLDFHVAGADWVRGKPEEHPA